MRDTRVSSSIPVDYPYMDYIVNPHLDNCLRDDCHMDIKQIVANRLAYFRELKNMTQADVSKRAGIAQSTVSRVESGVGTAADIETISQIAYGLGVSPWQLLSEDDVTAISKGDAELLAAVKKLARGK